jgi:hypothetical protein
MDRTLVGCTTRALLVAIFLAAAVLDVVLPAGAGAYPTIAPPPLFSAAPGLPDGLVYEQVSPADKNGNEAGASTNPIYKGSRYALAAADGNSVLFEGTGGFGKTSASYSLYFVAQRSIGGWTTRSILPSAQQSVVELGGQLFVEPLYVDPSPDLSHVMFEAERGTFVPPPSAKCRAGTLEEGERQLYLSGSEPELMTSWLDRPEIEDPIESCGGKVGESGAPVGGTPDFSTVYFTFPGTLLPEDASRAPNVEGGVNGEARQEAWGFYEDREGVLREAGVLPDGSLDPFGAVPAASGHGRTLVGNQVSADGSRAFFVSPDPASCPDAGGKNDCEVDPPELYVRENGEKTLLVSRDTLLPAEPDGLPAPAPAPGVFQMINPSLNKAKHSGSSYVFASPDGSQAFFQSDDDLTKAAEEAPPGAEPKTYDFDVDTGSLTYLPGVVGQIVVSNEDGSAIAFVDSGVSPAELDLWSAGPGGGSVTPITQLTGSPPKELAEYVPVARMSSNGSVVVFMSSMDLPGGFNSGTGFEQIYRYEAPTNTLSCVSCAPVGVTPTGSAEMANEQNTSDGEERLVAERGISSDGSRIFFDTPDPLVPQDTDGVRDVYEWENGEVYLISSGKSSHNSYFLDNSENGDDVFFATTDGLVPGDTDGGYDVYDARAPQPGDNPPPAAVPCEGSVCQGPPRVSTPLAAPASATFSGLGNLAPEPAAVPATKPKPKSKATKCKKGFVKKKNKCVKKGKAKKSGKRLKRGRK